jgi:type IV secretory pathway VirB9-like protein
MTLRKLVVAGALCAVLAFGPAGAHAQDSNPRLVTKVYDATKVVKIHGRPGVQATIAFADDERIENVAVGDSEKWQITPNKRANLLFARPLDPAASTNMTVVTDKRTYLFDLVATAKNQPVYMLRFTYGDEAQAPPPMVPAAVPPPVLAEVPSQPAALAPSSQTAQAAPEPQPLVLQQTSPSAPPVAASGTPSASAGLPPPAPPYASAVDAVVGAPPGEAVPVQSGARAEADKAGDPAPARLERTRGERQARARRSRDAAAAATPAQQMDQPAGLVQAAPFVVPPSPIEPGALNFAWTGGGRAALLPMRVYDDGRATYLVWGAKQAVPTVEVSGPSGENVAPQMTRHENSVVIVGVPSRILFSAEKASAWLDNLRAASAGTAMAGPLSGGQIPGSRE